MGGIRRFWNALPIDGAGFVPPADPDARWLIRFATRRRLGAAWLPMVIAARLLWCLKTIPRVRRASRVFGRTDTLRLWADACRYGLHPKDSILWRGPLGAPSRPLSTEAFSKIQSSVGDPGQRKMLGDKLATAAALERLGVPVPKLLAVIPKGTAEPVLRGGGDLFVKPQNGSRSRDAFRVEDRRDITARLKQAAARDTLLVQECLAPAPELADLATDNVPPVLRLITACEPGGQPFPHSAWLAIRVPGEPGSHILRGVMRVPVSIADGTLLAGYWLGEPNKSFETSPWHDTPIAGRTLPHFDAAVAAALAAAQAFDRLPTVGWDVILSDTGPVILEGNAHTDWLLITLVSQGTPDAPPLLPLLRRWAAAE
jgi:hypothetical protein